MIVSVGGLMVATGLTGKVPPLAQSCEAGDCVGAKVMLFVPGLIVMLMSMTFGEANQFVLRSVRARIVQLPADTKDAYVNGLRIAEARPAIPQDR